MLNISIKIFCITVFTFSVEAQQSKIDSIKHLIVNAKTDTAKIDLFDTLSFMYRANQKVDSCIWARKRALELNEKYHYSILKQLWENGGIDYMLFETGNYTESLKYVARHLALAEELNEKDDEAFANLVFGHDYRELGYYRESLNHYFKAKELFKSFYESRGRPEDNKYTLLCIAQVYLKMHQLDSALSYIEISFTQAPTDPKTDSLYLLLSYRITGDVYRVKGDDETAMEYYQKYIPAYVRFNEINRDLDFALVNVARIFQKRGQVDSSVLYAKKGLESAIRFGDQENIFAAGVLLYGYYDGKDDHAALSYLKIANRARDSMLTMDKLRQAQIFLFDEQVREKEEAMALAREKERDRRIILIGSLVGFIVSFLIWSRIRQLRLRYKAVLERKEAEKLKAKYEKELLELEAKALRAQMNPHFIFNCMNSIKALIQQHEEEKSIIYLTTFSKLIRTLFQNSDKRQISLYDEIETCQLYTQLEAMRFNEKLEYNFDIDPNLDLKSVMVPALIIQPFIENAIWHGIVPKGRGRINVSVKGKSEAIVCEIDDNGIGRKMAELKKPITQAIHESKGVRLSQTRLDIERMLSETQASIHIIDKHEDTGSTGTKVVITFNLN